MWSFKKKRYGTCEWDGVSKPEFYTAYVREGSTKIQHKDKDGFFICTKCNNIRKKEKNAYQEN